MGYDKGKMSGGSKFMDNGKGLCSYSSNPMKAASRTSSQAGPGSNPDQKKANGLLQKAHAKNESLRGVSGM
jgi:hypothetical protein